MAYCTHCGAEVGEGSAVCPSCGKPPAGTAQRKKKGGMSPVAIAVLAGCGCLTLIGLAGIVAAIFIPNFLDAMQKAKTKRTVVDMRTVGTAWLAWLTDEVAAMGSGQSAYDMGSLPRVLTATELCEMLCPDYLESVPPQDGWGHDFEYRFNPDLSAPQIIAIRSPGRDGVYESDRYTPGAFRATDYDQDLVWADGFFIRYPDSARNGPN